MGTMRRVSTQASVESNYIKCFGCSLILWFLCVLLFIYRNNENDRSSSSSNPQSSNPQIPSPNNLFSKTKPNTQSYAASLSPELTSNGWKPIYINVRSARMPVEEMDYLLEKYWIPRIDEKKNKNKN